MPTSNSTTRKASGADAALRDDLARNDIPGGTDTFGADLGSAKEAESAATGVEATGAQPESPLTEAGRDTIQTAGQLVERAADTGIRQADRGREQTAEGLHQLAGRIRMASSELETQQPAIANVTEFAAEGTERLASYLRETDVRQIISNVEDAARRQPLLFIGGAFLLGLAGARFLKAAGGPRRYGVYSRGQAGYGSASYGYRSGASGGDFATYGIGDQPIRREAGGV